MHRLVVTGNLKRIVNGAWGTEDFDIVKLSRYMRVLFQHALPENDYVAEDLLDQISNHAREASETEQPYPADELEWSSTMAFNHAIDLYCKGDDNACKRWAAKAIGISSFCSDNGALQGVLEGKLIGLSWDSQ